MAGNKTKWDLPSEYFWVDTMNDKLQTLFQRGIALPSADDQANGNYLEEGLFYHRIPNLRPFVERFAVEDPLYESILQRVFPKKRGKSWALKFQR